MEWRAHILPLEQFINSSFRCWGKGLLVGAWATSCCSKASPWGEREAKFRSRRSRDGPRVLEVTMRWLKRGKWQSTNLQPCATPSKTSKCHQNNKLPLVHPEHSTNSLQWCRKCWKPATVSFYRDEHFSFAAFSFWCEYFILHNKMSLLVNCEFIMELIFVKYKYQLTISF